MGTAVGAIDSSRRQSLPSATKANARTDSGTRFPSVASWSISSPDSTAALEDANVEEDAVVDVVEEDTAPGDDPVPAVAEEPDVSAAA